MTAMNMNTISVSTLVTTSAGTIIVSDSLASETELEKSSSGPREIEYELDSLKDLSIFYVARDFVNIDTHIAHALGSHKKNPRRFQILNIDGEIMFRVVETIEESKKHILTMTSSSGSTILIFTKMDKKKVKSGQCTEMVVTFEDGTPAGMIRATGTQTRCRELKVNFELLLGTNPEEFTPVMALPKAKGSFVEYSVLNSFEAEGPPAPLPGKKTSDAEGRELEQTLGKIFVNVRDCEQRYQVWDYVLVFYDHVSGIHKGLVVGMAFLMDSLFSKYRKYP